MAWTILNVLDNNLAVSASLKDENSDKYKCQRYKNSGEGNPTTSRTKINVLKTKKNIKILIDQRKQTMYAMFKIDQIRVCLCIHVLLNSLLHSIS